MADAKTFAPLIDQAQNLIQKIDALVHQDKIAQLQALTVQPHFWNRADAQEVMQQISWHTQQLEQIKELEQLTQDLITSQTLAAETTDEELLQLMQLETQTIAEKLQTLVQQLNIAQFLSGRYDQNSAILSIHPGQGGTEAMDWAEMLSRMYTRYFERKGWKAEFISEIRGEEAGIKEVSYEIKAPFAYGYLKKERGTHRLVRLSPFNADSLRQTSFALVEVMPVVDTDTEIEIKDEELSWHFTRSGGPGGQSVNKTSSAVELTHLPSGITVKSRQERSQVDNKKTALKILKAKLATIVEEKLEKNLQQEKGSYHPASWGTQIRNYVLHPYQLVKDTRTQIETSDTQAVLDGDLDLFIEAEVKL